MARDITTIILYEEKYREELRTLLIDFSQELFGEGTVDLDSFIKGHWAIYLAIKDDKVIGFTTFTINYYYGLRTPTVGFVYLYVDKASRRTKALYLLTLQALNVGIKLGLPLEYYCASDPSKRFTGKRVEGSDLYMARIIDCDELQIQYDNLNSRLNKV